MKVTITDALEGKLNLIKVRRNSRDIHLNFPDFLVIGPQRTGTTWLCQNLRVHPEIFITRPKELYYFSELKNGSPRPLVVRRAEKPGNLRRPREYLVSKAIEFWLKYLMVRDYEPDELNWYSNMFSTNTVEGKYRSVRNLIKYKRRIKFKMAGEGTATYAILKDDVLREITVLNPGIKAILMVREPVERAWSHAKKDLIDIPGRSIEEVSDEEFREFLLRDEHIERGMYSSIIEKWEGHIQKDHLFVGSFKDIVQKPGELLRSIFRFLGVEDRAEYVGGLSKTVVNPSSSYAVPDRVRNLLEPVYEEEKRRLKGRFGF